MVVQLQKIDFHCFVKGFNRLFYNYVLNISVIQSIYFNEPLYVHVSGFSCDRGRFMKNFRFGTSYSIYYEITRTVDIIVPVGSSASMLC